MSRVQQDVSEAGMPLQQSVRRPNGAPAASRVFPCQTPQQVRASLPARTHVVAFQCRNPIHRAHYELFMRALEAPNVEASGVVLVSSSMG